MDQASADLILALQAQDLADLRQDVLANGHDATTDDSKLALELYEKELRIAASLVRDHAYGQKVSRTDDHNSTPPSPVISPTPAFDRIIAEVNAHPTIKDGSDRRKDVESKPDPTDSQVQQQVAKDTSQANEGPEKGSRNTCQDRSITLLSNLESTLRFNSIRDIDAVVYSCVSCNMCEKEDEMVHAPCGDHYCEVCINQLFTMSMKDESLFPPRCCRQPIPLELASRTLGTELEAMFITKSIELTSTNRTYCCQSACGIFIPPSAINNEKARCSECDSVTCTICKGLEHDGDCPANPEHEALMKLAAKEGYQKCYQCKRLVEINTGCNHMT